MSENFATIRLLATTFLLVSAVACEKSAEPGAPQARRSPVHMPESDRIPKQTLAEFLANVRAGSDWDVDGDMLWGYFFTDRDRAKLERAAKNLEKLGYRFVTIYEPTDEDDDRQRLMLHVEKVETHDVNSLHARNAHFYDFAGEHDLESYDGMDVGQVAPDPPAE